MNIKLNMPDISTRPADKCVTKLKAEGVNLYYGSFQALRNITLDIPSCSITAIIGPSGCGKSSLLRLFNRMNDLIHGARLEGNVELDGTPIYSPKIDVAELRKRVGMVFQKPNPFPMSVFENVAYGPKRPGEKEPGFFSYFFKFAAALWAASFCAGGHRLQKQPR